MEAHVEVGVGDIELVRNPSIRSDTQSQSSPMQEYGGITRTTEIQITSFYDESDSAFSMTRQDNKYTPRDRS
jgi:hypothetical protein